MGTIKYKKLHSIDGFFNGKLTFLETKVLNVIKKNKIFSIIGKGNSISALPFDEGSLLVDFKENDQIKLNQKKSIIYIFLLFLHILMSQLELVLQTAFMV